jgi:hypothetical protein
MLLAGCPLPSHKAQRGGRWGHCTLGWFTPVFRRFDVVEVWEKNIGKDGKDCREERWGRMWSVIDGGILVG